MRELLRMGAAGVIVLALASVCLAEWPSIDFYTDGVIQDGNTFSIVRTFDDATVDMTGGNIQGSLELYNTSIFNAVGGWMGDVSMGYSARITLFDTSVINLRELEGGTIYGVPNTLIEAYSGSNAHINFYGYGFNFEGAILRGYWADGSEFAFAIRSNEDTQTALSFYIVPEPATFGILTIGFAILQLTRKTYK